MASAASIIEIDIKTKMFEPDERVHVLFPGEGYSQFAFMKERKLVYFDFPGLSLDDGPNDPLLKERLVQAEAIQRWHKSSNRSDRPSSDLSEFSESRLSSRRRTYVESVKRLYFEMKRGDIVLVPGAGHFGEVLVGEIRGKLRSVRIPGYGSDLVPVRGVEWIRSIPKRLLSEALVLRLALPIPLVQLDASLIHEVIRLAYDNYVFDGEYVAKFTTTEHLYNSVLDYDIQSLVNYVAGAVAIIEAKQGVGDGLTIESALDYLRAHPNLIPDLTSNINSPGALRYITEQATSIIVAVVFALALSGGIAHAEHIHVVNSVGHADDACAALVSDRVKQAFEIMNMPSLQKLCEHTVHAAAKTGIKPSILVNGVLGGGSPGHVAGN